jgi:ABC-type branched-subunit amino acid transport system substrate-binding protein
MLAAACGANGGSKEEGGGTSSKSSTTTTSATATSADFGDLKDVCGPGKDTVKAGQQGKSDGELNIGVASDRTSSIRPGLNKDMWDASQAFADWCNSKGGIGGLKINLIELNAALFDVEAAMSTACSDVFAMVGGGFVQDNLEFSGKEGSDFHKCGMIDLPGYAVSPEKSDSNGQVQPAPNPATSVSNTWLRDFKQLEPKAAKKVAIAYGDLPSLVVTKDKYVAALKDVGMDLGGVFSYPAAGLTDWTPLAQSIIGSGATSLMWVGEAGQLANLLAKLREQGWKGTPLLETNMYDPLLFSVGNAGPDGAYVRMTVHPVEEAKRWPATQQYLDVLKQYVPDARIGPLGIQATNAWLLFATAANACAKKDDGVIDRTCVLQQAAAVSDWTGGGLQAPADPARCDQAEAGSCSMLLKVEDGKFVRAYPKIGGKDDDGGGFHCPSNGVTQVPSNAGKGKVDPSRPI